MKILQNNNALLVPELRYIFARSDSTYLLRVTLMNHKLVTLMHNHVNHINA